MSQLLMPTCECGGPIYIRGEPRGNDADGEPLYSWSECDCRMKAAATQVLEKNAELYRRLAERERIEESIRKTGGWVTCLGYWVKDGEECPCCGVPQRSWKNEWGGWSNDTSGLFNHEGRMIWVCKTCWDTYSPKRE